MLPRDCDPPAPTSRDLPRGRRLDGGRCDGGAGQSWHNGDRAGRCAHRPGAPHCRPGDAVLHHRCAADARIGDSDVWALSVRVLNLDRAIIDLQLSPAGKQLYGLLRQPCRQARALSPRLLGRLVDETLQSAALGEPRRLTVYVPPGHDAADRIPVVYMADGAALDAYAPAIEAEIISGRIRPVLVVGVWPGVADPGVRARSEYLIGPFPSRAAATSATSLIDEVLPFAERTFGASDRPDERMLMGFSDGAAWALSMGLKRPDLFGQIAALSLGWPPAARTVSPTTAGPDYSSPPGSWSPTIFT